MKTDATAVIAALGLEPLPHEGGFFRQTWRTDAGSAILYLMTPAGFSALHRLRTDEIWHFHAGDGVEHFQLGPQPGGLRRTLLGPDVMGGHLPQLIVPGGSWQGARLGSAREYGWALLGATLAPPWDEQDFELGSRVELQRLFPAHAALIASLTR